MTLVYTLLALIALLLGGLVVIAAVRLSHSRLSRAATRSFSSAVRAAHAEMGLRDPYQVPRILATGSPSTVEALCWAWCLAPAGEPGWFGRVWHDAEALLLAEPHDIFSSGMKNQGSKAAQRPIRALLRNRPGRPLDAIVWVVSAETLIAPEGAGDTARAAALAASRQMMLLQRQFGMAVPLYVVIAGCDAVPGFDALACSLPSTGSDVPLGWASPYPPKRTYQPEWIDEAFVAMRTALEQTIVEYGTVEGMVSEALYLLPQRIDELREPFRERVDLLLRGAADGTAPLLRGVYCIGSTPNAGTGIPDSSPAAAAPAARAAAFAGRLWRDVFLGAQGLAFPLPRVLALRMRWHRVATAGAAVVAAVWLTGMLISWWNLRRDAQMLAASYTTLALAQGTYRASIKDDTAVAKALATFVQEAHKVPRWRLTSPFMPLSYVFLDGQLADAEQHVLRRVVFAPLHDRLAQRVVQLTCPAGAEAPATGGMEPRPQDMPEFVAGTQLVADTAQAEHLIALYDKVIKAGDGNLAMLDQVMREAVGVTLSPERIPDRTRLDAAVRSTTADPVTQTLNPALDFAAQRRISRCFEQLFDAWFDHVYADSALTDNAAQIQSTLIALRVPGALPTNGQLSELADRIDMLAAQSDSANHGWAGAEGKELVPGLAASFDTARRLQLIGPVAVQAALGHQQVEQAIFAQRWLVGADSMPDVLGTLPTGGLRLAPSLSALRNSVHTLLSQPFAARGNWPTATIDTVNIDTVQRSLAVLPAWQQFVAGPLAQAPIDYRGALTAAGQSDVVKSMVDALSASGRATPTARDGAALTDAASRFDMLRKNALNLITAFDSLGRDDLATAVVLRVSDAALDILHAADSQLQKLAPFQPVRGDFSGWDGRQGGALRTYGVSTPQGLEAYVRAQATAIADTADSAAGALDWLTTQKSPLAASDARLVVRWRALSTDLVQYRAKSPASALIAVQSIIAEQLDKLDVGTCRGALEQISVPDAGDIVSTVGLHLVASARDRCLRLQASGGIEAYEDIRGFFARYLAGRFPFASDANAPGADLQQTAAFVALLNKRLAQAQAGLTAAQSLDHGPGDDGRQFIAQLTHAKPWLDELFARGSNGALRGVPLSVDWRVARADEVGADQVIQWKLASGSDTLSYPSSGEPSIRWWPGLPVSISLRWAKNALWQPMFDAAQPALAGERGTAVWSSADAWALLRLMQIHQSNEDEESGVNSQAPLPARLVLIVPVRDRIGTTQTARMYMRIGMTLNGKLPAPIPPLPSAVPSGSAQARMTSIRFPAPVRVEQQADAK
ncbi:type VI secretion protein IcmF [Burkholderia lata]|uniref:Type VI secretion protein IcmF n=1 Tax=Burkholderia lata (strain ATCC 17760 / DSM 23089 / LMG 22485 / NCIMB 9086 / R18194 / 383) TaxID=482957 RepID=A0A6P2STA0_BURL3|nr:type VI secretion system protein [Burkholderia lata]VWC49393.1 type VI secretion protein IcmF [Burkholderia lata]